LKSVLMFLHTVASPAGLSPPALLSLRRQPGVSGCLREGYREACFALSPGLPTPDLR